MSDLDGSVAIGFIGHQIEVCTGERSAIRQVRRSFGALLATGSPSSSEVIRLDRSGDRYLLSRDGVTIMEVASPTHAQRALRHEIILGFVRAHPHLFWLHAGAAIADNRAVLFVARYGRGKSTLVTELCRRGWSYASDDVVPVDLSSGRILPFPLTPMVRERVEEQLPPERIAELRKIKVSLPVDRQQREPVPIGGIVLPEFRAGSPAAARPFSAAEVALSIVREGINREDHGMAAVALAARLVGDVPVLPLTFSDATAAADVVEREIRGRWSIR